MEMLARPSACILPRVSQAIALVLCVELSKPMTSGSVMCEAHRWVNVKPD